MIRKLGILAAVLCIGIGVSLTVERLYAVQTSQLPPWLSISSNDISSISVQGWGPGASGNFTVHPAAGQSSTIIEGLVHHIPKDRAIKPHLTPISTGGAEWLEIILRNGTSIDFASFPNEPKPFQYNVTLTNASGKQGKSAMISDVSGVVTSTMQAINSKGVIVRHKTH